MRFVNTKRFSPVVNMGDLPHEDDYFHIKAGLITDELLASDEYFVDEEWWNVQYNRCQYGFEVEEAVEPGGDMLVDGVDVFWSDDERDCYIPRYKLWIRDRKVKIPGRYYFYLNFWKIYARIEGTKRKGVINPRFIALDFFFSRRMDMMFEENKDSQELKARQLGFSEKCSGMLIGYNFTFIPASVNVIVAGDQEDADKTFNNTIRGLDELKNTQFYKNRGRTSTTEGITSAKFYQSEIHSLTARNKPQTVSRLSPTFVLYEEIGKGHREWSLKVAGFVKPSIYTEGFKTGWQVFIGTGGDMDEGGYDLEERYYNPEKHNILEFDNVFEREYDPGADKVGHFTGKDWFHIIDEDGNPLKEKSRKAIAAELALVDEKERYLQYSQWAIYASDALMRSTRGFFGETVCENLRRRKQYINSHRESRIIRRGRLVPKVEGDPWKGVEFKFDEKEGWIDILEEPEFDFDKKPFSNLYKGGLDSYDQDEAHTSDSKGAMVIKKGYRKDSKSPHYNTTVAMIVERPTEADGGAKKFYYHTVLAAIYYAAKVNIEYSNLRIFDFYIDNGFEALLKERPRLAFAGKIMKSQATNRYGTDKSLKPQILAIKKDSLTEEAIDRMYFVDEIEALSKFIYDPSGKKYNCDITIASCEAEVCMKDDAFIVVKSREADATKKKGIIRYKRVEGKLIKQFA